jgi:hypothetical protein
MYAGRGGCSRKRLPISFALSGGYDKKPMIAIFNLLFCGKEIDEFS